MIANIATDVPQYGGYAMRGHGAAFVFRNKATFSDELWAHLAAHESAHVVATVRQAAIAWAERVSETGARMPRVSLAATLTMADRTGKPLR